MAADGPRLLLAPIGVLQGERADGELDWRDGSLCGLRWAEGALQQSAQSEMDRRQEDEWGEKLGRERCSLTLTLPCTRIS